MCRNIKNLRRTRPPVSIGEIDECALHFVKKLSGYNKPSKANEVVFEKYVKEISEHTANLLQHLEIGGESTCVET
jgi:hypothetical protein